MHELHCKNRTFEGGQELEKGSKPERKENECPDCKALNSFRLLKANDPAENEALKNGYKQICVKCWELR